MVFTLRGDDGEDGGDAADGEGHKQVRQGDGGTRWCLECGSEWVDQLDDCPDCDLPLVDENPFTELAPPGPGEAHIEYELDAWAGESRVLLDQLLTGAGIAKVWQGGRLLVPERHEDAVDELVEQVEQTMLPSLDPDAEKVAFTLEEWSDDDYDALMARLEADQVPYEFDLDHNRVVPAEHGDHVDDVLDAIEHPDARDVEDGSGDRSEDLPDGEADDDDEAYDIDPDEVLGGLFVATDRLRKDARDRHGVIGVAEQGQLLVGARPPYGVAPGPWATLRARVQALLDLLSGDSATDDEVEAAADELRTVLRQYV